MKKLLSFLIMLITVMPHAQANLEHSVYTRNLEQVKQDIAHGEQVTINDINQAAYSAAGGNENSFKILQFLIEHGGKAVINQKTRFYYTGSGVYADGTPLFILKLARKWVSHIKGSLSYQKVVSYLQIQGAHE